MLMGEKGMDSPRNTPTALTDGDGNFQMKNVQAGTYFAMVNAPGVISPLAFADISNMRSGISENEELSKASEGFEKIVVDGITDIDVQIPARRGGAIGGRVSYDNGDPAIGVKVEILRKVKDKFLPVVPNFGSFFSMMIGGSGYQTDDRGIYRFSGLPAGEYIVKITENISHVEKSNRSGDAVFEMMFGGGGTNSLLNIFYPDAFDSKSANIINVELGQEISEINLTIPSRSLYSVEGKIVARKDKSPVKARISIKREGEEGVSSIFGELGRREESSTTDENGNWKFKELPKGNYKLIVEPVQGEIDYSQALSDYYNSNSNVMPNLEKYAPPKPKLAKKVQEIKLDDKDLSEIIVELGSGATISGNVTIENKGEMPKSLVMQAVNEASELTVTGTVGNTPDALMQKAPKPAAPDNDFRLENVPEGKTFFYVQHDENYYVKSAKAGNIDLLGGAIDLKDGEIIENAQIILATDVATVKGKILDAQNEPMKKGDFVLVPTDASKQKNSTFYRNVFANEKGEFERKLAPGEYAVVFIEESAAGKKYEEFFKYLAAAVKDAQKVTVEAGKTENLVVKKIK
jgi:hypothetical protein